MRLFQIPLEPAYPMAFQAVSVPPASSPKWQGFGCSKLRDVQSLGTMRDTPSMVQKLLEEEREAVKSALQAVDEHMQFKKKEVEEVHRKLMKDESHAIKDHFKAAFTMDLLKTTSRNNRVSSAYSPVYNPQPPKIIQQQKPVFLEAIFEEDNDSGAMSHSSNKNEKRSERIRHSSAMPSRNPTARSRAPIREKVTSARVSEMSVLPPIDSGWSNIPTDGTYIGPLNYRWQRVADNYIDSDVRVRSRRRCQSRAQETRLRIGYFDEEDETEDEIRIPRKRQITFGPPHSTSYSRWLTHYTP